MIHKFFGLILIWFMITSINFGAEKKVLVEIFTNSHCPLCPPAHTSIDSYLQSANGDKIEFIYYHMSFPYSSDQLYQHNTGDAAAKNSFYGPHSSTPKAYFDGTLVPNSYSNWASNLDNLALQESAFEINLSGNYSENSFTIDAEVTQSGDVSSNNLTVNFVVVEDVTYAGNNGISEHKNVMRKIINPQGESISINKNETKNFSQAIEYNSIWNSDNISVVVFIQDKDSKEIFQSAAIPYSGLMVTDVEDDNILPETFSLEQNYPNPFNPTTTILYTIPNIVISNPLAGERSTQTNNSEIPNLVRDDIVNVKLTVYDLLGSEVTTLVNKQQNPGSYKILFNASFLSNGIYYYQLTAGNFIQTKKMILLK